MARRDERGRSGRRGVRTFGDLEPGGHGGIPRWWRSVTASELDKLAGVRSPATAVGFQVRCRNSQRLVA